MSTSSSSRAHASRPFAASTGSWPHFVSDVCRMRREIGSSSAMRTRMVLLLSREGGDSRPEPLHLAHELGGRLARSFELLAFAHLFESQRRLDRAVRLENSD